MECSLNAFTIYQPEVWNSLSSILRDNNLSLKTLTLKTFWRFCHFGAVYHDLLTWLLSSYLNVRSWSFLGRSVQAVPGRAKDLHEADWVACIWEILLTIIMQRCWAGIRRQSPGRYSTGAYLTQGELLVRSGWLPLLQAASVPRSVLPPTNLSLTKDRSHRRLSTPPLDLDVTLIQPASMRTRWTTLWCHSSLLRAAACASSQLLRWVTFFLDPSWLQFVLGPLLKSGTSQYSAWPRITNWLDSLEGGGCIVATMMMTMMMMMVVVMVVFVDDDDEDDSLWDFAKPRTPITVLHKIPQPVGDATLSSADAASHVTGSGYDVIITFADLIYGREISSGRQIDEAALRCQRSTHSRTACGIWIIRNHSSNSGVQWWMGS